MLRDVNPWVRSYSTMKDVIDDMRRNGLQLENMILVFSTDMQRNLRNYNLPESRSDVAAVFYGGEPPFPLNLKVYPRDVAGGGDADADADQRVNRELKNLNPLTDPMVYPLLFPNDELGHDINIKYRNNQNKTVTFAEHYRYRIQIREEFSILHNS